MRIASRRFTCLAIFTCAPLAVLAWPPPAHAADEPLSLNKAVERAVTGNPDLRRERLNIETADARLESARGFFDVNLTGGFTFSRTTRPSLGPQDIQAGSSSRYNLDLGVARNLETGGTISLGLQGNRSRSNSPFQCGTLASTMAQETCNIYNTQVGLNFTQPLLRGFGPNFALANVRRAQIQKDQALLNRQMRASNVLRDVINTYWALAYATQFLAIQRSAVELAREQLRVTKAQIDVGRSAPVDAAAVERAIGERMQDVLLAEQELLFRTLELRRLLGQPVNPGEPLFAATDAPQGSQPTVDVNGEVKRALEVNPQLRSTRLGIALSEIDVQTAVSSLRPQLDFVGSIGANGLNREVDESFSQTLGFESRSYSAGLRFALPVQNRVAGGQERVARSGAERAQLEAADLEIEIRYQVQRLTANIQTASKRVELAKATVGFATQNLEAEKARFSVGRSTNNEVLRVQQELKSAEIQGVRATVDLLVAENNLIALTGELLDHHRITLKGL